MYIKACFRYYFIYVDGYINTEIRKMVAMTVCNLCDVGVNLSFPLCSSVQVKINKCEEKER